MPRLKQTAAQRAAAEAENRRRKLIGVLNKYRMICGYNSWEIAADALGMSRSTLFRRAKDPGTFTLDEMHQLIRALRIPKEELSDVIFY